MLTSAPLMLRTVTVGVTVSAGDVTVVEVAPAISTSCVDERFNVFDAVTVTTGDDTIACWPPVPTILGADNSASSFERMTSELPAKLKAAEGDTVSWSPLMDAGLPWMVI